MLISKVKIQITLKIYVRADLHAIIEKWKISILSTNTIWEKEMASHFNILAWRIPWTEKPGFLQSMGFKASDTTEQLSMHTWA